jgi:hypothetical protein
MSGRKSFLAEMANFIFESLGATPRPVAGAYVNFAALPEGCGAAMLHFESAMKSVLGASRRTAFGPKLRLRKLAWL